MSDSFRTICRVAFVAVGLTFGSTAAYAATATIDCPGGTLSFANNVLTCTVGTKCSISGPSSAVVNTQFTLNASCPSGSNYTWAGTGGASSCSGASCDITETGTGSKSYTVQTETAGSLSSSYAVNITSGAVAPSGCTLSANPTSGPSGTNVTLTANCTSGTAPITVAWGGASGTSGCPTSINGSAINCTINGVTANSTWTASFSNAGGNFANNPRSAAFTVQAGGGGAFAGCPAGTVTIDGQWGNTAIVTGDYGNFTSNIMSVRLSVPANWTNTSTQTSSWVEFGDGGVPREAVLSKVACDFTTANAVKSSLGAAFKTVNNLRPAFKYKSGASTSSVAGLTPGQDYYLNFRNYDSNGLLTCTSGGTCNMRGGLPQ